MSTPRTRLIVGLTGYAGSGKDTAAAALVERGWCRMAFADALRDMALAIDPWVEAKPCQYLGARVVRLSNVVWWHGWDVAKTDFPDVRHFLQRLGTEGVRRHFGDDAWVRVFADRYARLQAERGPVNVVVPDVRFPNEAAYIQGAGGVVVRVERPGVRPLNLHASELEVASIGADFTLSNTGTADELKAAMLRWVERASETHQ